MTESCSYAHDISGERFEDLDDSTWDCPHETVAGTDLCPFHASSDHVDDGATVAR